MDELVFSCTDALDQAATPACTTDYGERIVRVAYMKDGATFTVAGSDVPTAAEFQTSITSDVMTIINGLSNGHRVEQGATELSGDDTETGGTERYDVDYRIEYRIKRINESVKRMTEKLDRYSTLRMWYFTDKNYCYGGTTGYLVAPNFSLVITEGKGQPPYIQSFNDFTAIGADYAGYDADYDTLTNS